MTISPAEAGFLVKNAEEELLRILGLDVGDKRIGVAVSDALGFTAQGVETIFAKSLRQDADRVEELARAYETTHIVAGLPKLLSGEEGAQTARVRRFCHELTARGFEVRFMDERLTSVSAERLLIGAGVKRQDRKKVIDKLAATYILEAFMQSGGWKEDLPREEDEAEVFRLMEDLSMERDNIVTLLDENDKELKFEHLMTLEFQGRDYVVLAPAEEMEDIDSDEAVILRIDKDAEGNDVYTSLTDEEELEKVFERYLEIAGEDEGDESEEE